MKPEVKRQVMLVGLLVVAVLGYLRFGAGWGTGEAAVASTNDLPPIDVAGLMSSIKDVATINPVLISATRPDSDADRNLFQYGVRRPPPPTPAELEAQRKAAEAQLALQEQQLREQKERERIAEEERVRQAELLAQQNPQPPQPDPNQPPPPPPPPAKPAPPAINFKLMGMMGPPERKLGVFLDGDKVMMARQGDVLMGQFKVLAIGVESAEIGYVDPVHKDFKKKLQLGQ
jgi:hypothetical protein